jgi:hypothetical protein
MPATHVVHPSLALFGQMPRSNRDDGVVVLKVVGKVSEKVDKAETSGKGFSWTIRRSVESLNSQFADAFKVGRTPFLAQRLGIVKEPYVPAFKRHFLLQPALTSELDHSHHR